MQSPKRVLQVLIPPNVAVQRIQKESDVIESKMKVVIMGLEIERLHKVANIITDKYEDKLQQLETQQQLLNDKIENQDVKIGTLNQQLLLKDDFINEIFEEKCPDEVNKKLNQQLKQVTSQLNRAKKQIETLNEMNIIFKKNPPESPELADKIQQLESNYEEIIQKKDQEITNLKIRNSSYDHSHSQEISDQKSELMKLQLENQFLNEKMDELIEENEKLKQQLIQSVKQSIQSIPEYKLVTQVIQQEPFHAFTDFQLLGRNDAAQSSQVSFSQPQKTPYQNNQEIMKNLRQFEKLQTDGQFTHEKVLQQVRLCATLLHLKRMELPEDINDSNVVYLNKIEKTDSKKGSKQDLASTVKPKKLFSKHNEPVTQEKQLRSQSVRSNAIEVQKRNQFVQVDFQDYKQLEQTQQQLENLKKDYHQISKLVNAKLQKESIPKQQNQSDIQNSVESDELQKQDRKEGSSKIKDSLNKMNERLSDYSFRESQIQQNRDKINVENFKKQLENFEEQNQYLRQQNQQQQNLIKKLQEKADKNLPNDYQLSENQHLINYLQQEVSTLNQQLQEQKQNIKSKFTDNKLIQTDKAKVLHKYNQTEIDIDVQKLIDLNELNFQNQIIQMQEEMNDLKALNDHLQQEHLQLQNQIKELQIKLHGTAEEKDLLQLEMQQKLQYQLNKINLESGDNENLQDQLKQLKEQFYKLKLENVDLLEKIKIPIKSENNQDEYLNQIDQLQKLLEQTKLELQQKHLDLEQLENEHELQQKQLAELQAENQNLHQFIKDQENEYQTQMSQIRYRISVLEEQQIKEHSRSVSISDDQTKEQQTEVVINPDYEIQIRRLQDEKSVLLTELQKQIQESKQIIKDMQNEFAFQRLQLEEKIQELESKIVLYRDGDAQLMQENQNLANQITNLTNQLTLARQTSKIQSSKTLKSVTVSPREQITQQEILDLKNNVNDLQLKIISLEKENNELENLNQRLTQQLQQIKTENNFESEDNKRLKSQNQSLRDQIQVLNKQIIVIQKNFKQEIDCLNIQIQTYTQNKIIESQDKSTQLDYTIDSRIFKERDDLIYQLKKLIHKKDIEFDDLQQNLLISRQEIFKLNDHIRKLNSIRLNQQVEQQRQYQQCSLHPQRGRASSFQIVRTVSEDRGALKKVEFWQKKYETLLQENYSTKSIKQTPEFKTQYDEILNKQQLTQQELEQQQGSNLKLKQMIEQLQINILEIKQQNILQNNEQLIKKEMEIQSSRLEINQLKNNLEIAQQECQKWKNQLEVLQNQQKIEVNKETHTLEIQRLTQDMKIQQNANNEKEIQVKQYLNDINQLKYETDQLRNQVRILQSEKQELLSSKQNNIEQQNIINKLDDRCHLLLTELNMLKTEYRQLEINYKIESKQQDAQFSRFEIMHNLDIIKQELRAYQTKCQLQEQELTQLRFQIHQPLQRSSDKLKEQYQYLGEIIKELEVTKLQNENLRKQNAELTQFQNTLTKENENLKRINSPLASPRLKYDQKQQQQLYQQQQYQQQYYQQQQQQQQQQQKQEEIDELKYELDSLKRQVLNSSTQVREAETLSLQARVLTLEQKLVQEIENLKYLTQENKELRSQMEQMRSQQRIIDQQPDFNQVEKLNRDLNEKISELTQLKIKYKQALQVMQRLGMMNIQQNKV